MHYKENYQDPHNKQMLLNHVNPDIEREKPQINQESEVSEEDLYRDLSKLTQSKARKCCQPFAPFLINTLYVKAEVPYRPGASEKGFDQGAISYNQKHNMIIACTKTKIVQFYNAKTLQSLKERPTKKIDGSFVMKMAFCEEAEAFILGCSRGEIYIYNVSEQTLEQFPKKLEYQISAIECINSGYFAVSAVSAQRFYLGNMKNGGLVCCNARKSEPISFCNLPKEKVLLVSLKDGSIIVYCTKQLPRLAILGLIRSCEGEYIEILHVEINRKEYIVTSGTDWTVRIWHLIRGKLRILRAVYVEGGVNRMVYLENYRMLAIINNTSEIQFLSLLSGKLKYQLNLSLGCCTSAVLMKDKNAIAVPDCSENIVRIIQLHSS